MGRSRLSARSVRQLLAFASPFVLGAGLLVVGGGSERLTPERIQAHVLSLGGLGLLGFLAAAALRPTLLLVSGSLFAIAAGLVWGPVLGTLAALAGSLASAATLFALARRLGRDAVRELLGPRYEPWSEAARSRAFPVLVAATLGYLVPTDWVVAVAAASGVRARTVFAATALGGLPGTAAMAWMGAHAVRPTAAVWAAGAAAVLLLSAIGLWLGRRLLPTGARASTRGLRASRDSL